MTDFETMCFFIAPIGKEGTEERERSDGVRDYIVKPAVEPHGLTVVRADAIGQPGQITHQVVEHVLGARAAVADLTGRNANVYYELALRHMAELPVVLIADANESGRLPFDMSQMRTVFYDPTNLKSATTAKEEITKQMGAALEGAVDSPVATAVNVKAARESGSGTEQLLADLVSRVDRLSEIVGRRYSFADPITWALASPGEGSIVYDDTTETAMFYPANAGPYFRRGEPLRWMPGYGVGKSVIAQELEETGEADATEG